MSLYDIYSHPDGRVEAVKQGWSWPAVFLGGFWALSKRLWPPAGAAFLIAILGWFTAPFLAGQGIAFETIELAHMVIAALMFRVFGAYGNRWYATKLQPEGFRRVSKVSDIDASRTINE
ncbi:uncharacterized protein DUF2628 [Marinobacter sp. LV10R520-4]|uniref:DUF2628 domain-containing protein n=1 Tax=Marinobacter sp. LV10R520-4 TaxID=1761796 RepID=UPI000BF5899A|nr:DUF2628 domain-containing protein [Marinobacter sp. LV10R520-4]PFG52666.1 uncharacterized protein DUF2628 [Marinobacter sp. LV10R520-4]